MNDGNSAKQTEKEIAWLGGRKKYSVWEIFKLSMYKGKGIHGKLSMLFEGVFTEMALHRIFKAKNGRN